MRDCGFLFIGHFVDDTQIYSYIIIKISTRTTALAQGSNQKQKEMGVMGWQYFPNITKTHKTRLLNSSRARPGLAPWVNPGTPGCISQDKVASEGLEGTASQVQTQIQMEGRRETDSWR